MVDPPAPADPACASLAGAGRLQERSLLERLIAGPVSGDALARATGLTLAAVGTGIQALRAAGVSIDAHAGGVYQLAQPFDLLDNDAIVAALPAAARARMSSLTVSWTLDSTNSELQRSRGAAAAAADGAARVLLAERQTGGRGRRGREWHSPLAAHLYLSLARSFSGGWSEVGGLSLVAGIATVEALHALGYRMVRLKWPNDLVVTAVDGSLRKLGGLLVEGAGEQPGPVRAVIGLGLNVRMPERFGMLLDQPWCDLSQLPVPTPSRNTLAAAIITRWVPALDEFDRTGLAPLLGRYAAIDAIAGQPIRVSSETAAIAGTAVGLASDGSLRVRLADGSERCFHAGEVSVRRDGAGR